jgi:hypothetical protein
MPPLIVKPKPFKLLPADRTILNDIGPQRHDIFAKHYFDVELFPWQQYYLAYPCKNKLVVAGIRTGKSFVAAYELLNFAFWNPGSRVLNVCITADQAQIIFNDIVLMATNAKFNHWVAKIINHPYPTIILHNGAEIWSRSIGGTSGDATTLRGWEFDVINVDEAAYVTNELAIMTLQGRLIGVNKQLKRPRYGLLTMKTTPKGAKTWLYDRWKRGDPQYPGSDPKTYLSLQAKTSYNTLLDAATIALITADYTEAQRQQELEGIFLSDDSLFHLQDLVACAGKDVSDIFNEHILDADVIELEKAILTWMEHSGKDTSMGVPQTIEHYELDPIQGHVYVAGWDLGSRAVISGVAEGRNATVGAVFDISTRPWKMVAYKYDTFGKYTISMEWVRQWHLKYNSRGAQCFTRIDALGSGDVIHQILEEERYRIDGFKASTITKGAMLQAAAYAIEMRWIRWPFIRRMIDQFQSYTPEDKHIAQDIVIAIGQAIHLARAIEGGQTHDEQIVANAPQHGSLAGLRRTSREVRVGRRRRV